VDVLKSKDNDFHVTKVKFSRGQDQIIARSLAEKITFQTTQNDSTLMLPKGFAISKAEKFRNQQVLMVLQVPVGKRFLLDKSVSHYDWFDIRYNRRGGFEIDDDWNHTYWVESGKEYIMTPDGPKEVSKLDQDALKRGEYKEKEYNNVDNEDDNRREEKQPAPQRDSSSGKYRYHNNQQDSKKDTAAIKKTTTT
jgi:hypothetical protein